MQTKTYLTYDNQRKMEKLMQWGTESLDDLHKFLREAEYNVSIHFKDSHDYEIVDISVRPMDDSHYISVTWEHLLEYMIENKISFADTLTAIFNLMEVRFRSDMFIGSKSLTDEFHREVKQYVHDHPLIDVNDVLYEIKTDFTYGVEDGNSCTSKV